MVKNKIKIPPFVLIMSGPLFLLFHYPFFKCVFNNLDYKRFNGVFISVSLVIAMLVANAFVLFLLFFLSRIVGKFLLVIFFLINAVAVYFVNTYSVIIDESMIGNILNTNYSESVSYTHLDVYKRQGLIGIFISRKYKLFS